MFIFTSYYTQSITLDVDLSINYTGNIIIQHFILWSINSRPLAQKKLTNKFIYL